MTERTAAMRQLIDGRAAVLAGLISGLVFFIVSILLPLLAVESPWLLLQVMAATILGKGVLPPPVTLGGGIFVASLFMSMALALIAALLLAIIIHRWGLIVGVVGGAIFGLILYTLIFYGLALAAPWMIPYRSWMVTVAHVLLGMTAGGIYELLEVERYVPREVEPDEAG